MNVSAPTIMTTPINNTTNSALCVGKVPGPVGMIFLRANEPAMANVGIASQKRANSIANPPVKL